MTPRSPTVVLRDRAVPRHELLPEILESLQESPRRISPKYFYDERGSKLFDAICDLPEYYLTRTETQILETHGEEIAAAIGAESLLIDYGSGSSRKTRLLLDRLPHLAAYVPVDISRSFLLACARAIDADYPHLHVLPVCADFTKPFTLPAEVRDAGRRVAFFPGSTLGNFERDDAIALLRQMRDCVGPDGAAVIGADMVKDVATLEAAYNDSRGLTADFNLNVLVRLNREFGTNFDVDRFRHEAPWVAERSRIEMHLVSLEKQSVDVGGETIELERGERLLTECCHKYTQRSLAALAEEGGWTLRRTWTDRDALYGVHYLD